MTKLFGMIFFIFLHVLWTCWSKDFSSSLEKNRLLFLHIFSCPSPQTLLFFGENRMLDCSLLCCISPSSGFISSLFFSFCALFERFYWYVFKFTDFFSPAVCFFVNPIWFTFYLRYLDVFFICRSSSWVFFLYLPFLFSCAFLPLYLWAYL